jgi:hypothetical protein
MHCTVKGEGVPYVLMEPGATLQSAATAAIFAFEQEIASSATMSAFE